MDVAVVIALSAAVGVLVVSLTRDSYAWVAADPPSRAWVAGAAAGAVVGTTFLVRRYLRRTSLAATYAAAGRPALGVATRVDSASATLPIPVERVADVAAHEAAHAVAALSFDFEVTEIRLARGFSRNGGAASHVRTATYLSTERPDAAPIRHWWGAIVVALAGSAMDRARGLSGWPGIEDMNRAHTFSEVLYRYRAPLPDNFSPTSVDDLVSHGIEVAEQFVLDNQAAIEALAESLIAHTATPGSTASLITGAPLRELLDPIRPRIPVQ